MKTVADLGKAYKLKHKPRYDHRTDEEVGRAVKLKYPGKYREYLEVSLEFPFRGDSFELEYQQFEQTMLQTTGIGSLEYNSKLPEQFQKVWEFYNPNQGFIGSYFKRKVFRSHAFDYSESYQTEKALLDSAVSLANAVHEQRRKAFDFYKFMKDNFNQLLQMQIQIEYAQQALENKMLPDDWSAHNYHTAQSLVAFKDYKERKEIELRDYEQRKQVDFNNEVALMEQKVKWAMIAKTLSTHQKIILVQQLLDGLYKEIEDIRKSQYLPETKKRMEEDREEVIKRFKGYINAEGDRLLEAR